jgi:hypothetical protein
MNKVSQRALVELSSESTNAGVLEHFFEKRISTQSACRPPKNPIYTASSIHLRGDRVPWQKKLPEW